MQRREFVKFLGGLPLLPSICLSNYDVNIKAEASEEVDPRIGKDLRYSPPEKDYEQSYGISSKVNDLLRRTGDFDLEVAAEALEELAESFSPIINTKLFNSEIYSAFDSCIYPIGNKSSRTYCHVDIDRDTNAFSITGYGRTPEKYVDGDYIMVPIYDHWYSIDWLISYSRDARWDVIGKALEVFSNNVVDKLSIDGYNTLLAAAVDKGEVCTPKRTKKFHSGLLTSMALNLKDHGKKLTDVYLSADSIKEWYVRHFGEKDFYKAVENNGFTFKGVRIHFSKYFLEGKNKSFLSEIGYLSIYNERLQSYDVCLGADLSTKNTEDHPFIIFRPECEDKVRLYGDRSLHRNRRAGIYGYGVQGIACFDNKGLVLGEYGV